MSLEYTEDECAAVLAALAHQEAMLKTTNNTIRINDQKLHDLILNSTRTALAKAEHEYNERWGVLR